MSATESQLREARELGRMYHGDYINISCGLPMDQFDLYSRITNQDYGDVDGDEIVIGELVSQFIAGADEGFPAPSTTATDSTR